MSGIRPGIARREILASALALPVAGCAGGAAAVHERFGGDLRNWTIEQEAGGHVSAANGVLDVVSEEGITLWFRRLLTAPVVIDYEVMAVAEGGALDRVSDVNAFWMARDPAVPGGSVLARARSGAFADYDTLRTYYVGIGGNRNTTTRMRRYVGAAGYRPLLPQHDRSDAAAMLQPNRWMRVRLSAHAQGAAVDVDGKRLFTLRDTAAYMRGHFGLRTTRSHIRVRRLMVRAKASSLQ